MVTVLYINSEELEFNELNLIIFTKVLGLVNFMRLITTQQYGTLVIPSEKVVHQQG